MAEQQEKPSAGSIFACADASSNGSEFSQPAQKSSEQEEGEEEMPIVPPLFDTADGPSGLVQSMESVSLRGAMETHHSDAGGGRDLLQSQSHAPLGPIVSARNARQSPAVVMEKLQQTLGANALQMEVAHQITLELLVSSSMSISVRPHC